MVFPGSQTSDGGRLVGIQAGAVVHSAGLQHRREGTPVAGACRRLTPLLSHRRSAEPSHSRAGLTSIGLEIERTPLSDQTSPRRAAAHSFKTSRPGVETSVSESRHRGHGRSRRGFKTSIGVVVFRVEASGSSGSAVVAPATSAAPSAPNDRLRGCPPVRWPPLPRSEPNSLPPSK